MNDSTEPGVDVAAWVGRGETTHDISSRSAVLGLAALLDNPMDPASADAAILHPLGHWLQFSSIASMSDLGRDGHPRLGGFMPPLLLPRRMWAGSSITYHRPVVVGQRLRRTTTIEAITPKTGSTGSLCFVALRHEVQAEDELALTEHQTIVYREAVTVDPAAPSPARPPREDGAAPEADWDWVRTVRPDEVTLFRYSALTFNSHRIHYDHPYATRVEGYPGLVVHGPLSATYLVDGFLRHHPNAMLTSFEFSARAPLYAGEQLHVVGRADRAGREELAVLAPDGQPAVTASIEYR